MSAISSMTTVTCNMNNLWPRQGLIPEIIIEKKWTSEHKGSGGFGELTWDKFILSIPLQGGGGGQHSFKAYILDTSGDQKSFTLLLEDQVKNDSRDGVTYSVINVDLKDYAEPGTTFKIMRLAWGNSGSIIGELTFG